MQQPLLPLFPLSVVLLPGKHLPLHIFEERYKEMVGEALLHESEFGIVQAKDNGILRTGCTAVVDTVLKKYEDGRLDIMTIGQRRFNIDQVDTERSFLRAAVTFLEDDNPAPGAIQIRQRALRAFEEYLKSAEEESEIPDEDHPQLSFVLASVSNDLDFLQALLSIQSEAERIQHVATHLEELLTKGKLRSAMRKVAGLNGHGPKFHDLNG